MANAPQLFINIWSDYVCPFCYLEEPVLEQLQAEFGEKIKICWRAYELRPDPIPTLDPNSSYLHDIWGRAVYPMAEERGLTLRLPPVQPRSRRAHEAAEFARRHAKFEAMNHALFKTFFEDGRDLHSISVLADIAASIGLDVQQLQTSLEQGQYTAKVLTDQTLAREHGVTAVPAMAIDISDEPTSQAVLVSGAQPYEFVREVIETLLAEQSFAALREER
jgi:predicted DsbA family dithiol-disulfide isomerase